MCRLETHMAVETSGDGFCNCRSDCILLHHVRHFKTSFFVERFTIWWWLSDRRHFVDRYRTICFSIKCSFMLDSHLPSCYEGLQLEDIFYFQQENAQWSAQKKPSSAEWFSMLLCWWPIIACLFCRCMWSPMSASQHKPQRHSERVTCEHHTYLYLQMTKSTLPASVAECQPGRLTSVQTQWRLTVL